MKRTALWIASFVLLSTNVFADGLTATLQQGEKMTPYYGIDAFKQAYAAADSGAVITLSSGKFNDVTTIEKSVTIIGAYAFDAASTETTLLGSLTIGANNVKVEGIYFSGTVILGEVSDCQIKKCWVETELTSTANHTNTIVDQCVIKADKAVANGYNYCIKNSTIQYFKTQNTVNNIAYITNCVVYKLYDCSDKSYKHPIGLYRDCILGVAPGGCGTQECDAYTLKSPSEYYNVVFFNHHNLNYSGQLPIVYDLGCQYSNVIVANPVSKFHYPAEVKEEFIEYSPYSGTGFSFYPNIPRITSKTIDSNTDADGKLNVKITVKAQ